MGRLIGALLFAMLSLSPALGQDAATDTPWQDAITHQIEAFRHGDAPEAFAYAGQKFQDTFSSPYQFFAMIIASGYAPIMQSSSHGFGHYELLPEHSVMQIVTLVGKDQERYEAVYQLTEEAGGWRVQGVALQRVQGIGV